MAFRDIGDGNGGDVVDGEDNAEVFFEAFDHADDATEGPFGDLYMGTGATGKGEVVKIDDLIGTLGGDTDELLHLRIRDMQHLSALGAVGIDDGAHDLAQRLVEVT